MRRTPLAKNLVRAAALTAAGALALTGCGGGSAGDPNKIVFWDTSGPNEHPVFRKLADDCAARGGYRVQSEQVAFDQARSNYKTNAQGGQGPDVFRAEVAWVSEFAKNGLIQDLSGTELVKDSDDFLDVALGSTRYEGKTYGVPQVTDTLALLYNKKMLADAGIEAPRTWDEVKAAGAKLGEKAFFVNNDGYYALPFIYGEGGDLVDTEAKKITVNSPASVRGVETAKSLLDAKAAQTAQDPSNSYNNMKAAFSSGQVAMIIDGPWAVVDLLASDAFKNASNLGIAPVPGATAGRGSGPVGGHNYVIRQGTRARDNAIKFIQCMSSVESQTTIAKELGLLPTRKAVYDDAEVKSNPVVTGFAEAIRTAHARAWIPEGGQLFDPLKIGYADVLSGKKTAKAALDEVAKAYKDQVVKEYSQG